MAKLINVNLDFNSVAKPVNLPDPTSAQDAATKAYVDSAVEGIAWKTSCRVSTQSNIDLSSPGSTIDGITMSTSDRVLVRAQTSDSENGIYIWNGSAVAMTRSADCSTSKELEQAITTVEEGTSAGVSYRQTSINFTINSGSVSWSTFGQAAGAASTSSAGIVELATLSEVNTGTDADRAVTPSTLAGSNYAKKLYAANFGDGSATSYAITHNIGTRDVQVQVYRNSGNYDTIEVDVQRTSTTVVTVVTASAPSSNAYRIVVIG